MGGRAGDPGMGRVMKSRVFIVADHGVLRGGLRALVDMQADMEVVGEAGNRLEAEMGIKKTEADIALMDISTPDGGGLATIAAVRQIRPKARIIVLTVHEELGYIRAAQGVGAVGYVVKTAVDTELLAAIRAVVQGRSFMDVSICTELGGHSMQPKSERAADPRTAQLSERERQVMGRVAEGYTNGQIAEQLGLGVKSIETYRSRLMEKLGMTRRSELVRFALDCGIFATDRPTP